MFLVEDEYIAAMLRAELAWLGGIIDDLRTGRLTPPTEAELRRLSPLPGTPSEAALGPRVDVRISQFDVITYPQLPTRRPTIGDAATRVTDRQDDARRTCDPENQVPVGEAGASSS